MRREKNDEIIYKRMVLTGCWDIDESGQIWSVGRRASRGDGVTIFPRKVSRVIGYENDDGYLVVEAKIPGAGKIKTGAHRVVYRHFNGSIPDGLQINHINGVKTDNRPENLEVVTQQENIAHSIESGAHSCCRMAVGEDSPKAKLTELQVHEVRGRHSGGESMSSVARDMGVHASTVYLIVHRKNWKHI